MDRTFKYILSLFAMLTDEDKDEIIALMLSSLSLQESASAQRE